MQLHGKDLPWGCTWVLILVSSFLHSQPAWLNFPSGFWILVWAQRPLPTRPSLFLCDSFGSSKPFGSFAFPALWFRLSFLVWVLLGQILLVWRKIGSRLSPGCWSHTSPVQLKAAIADTIWLNASSSLLLEAWLVVCERKAHTMSAPPGAW